MAIFDVDVPEPRPLEPASLADDEAENKAADPLVDYVVDRFSDYQKQRNPLEKKWDAWYRMWRCLPDDEDQTEGRASERSQIKIPATKEAVTNAVDSIYQILFPPDWFDIEPQPTDLYGLPPEPAAALLADKVHKATLVKLYERYLFDREMLESKLYRFLQDSCIYGTAVLRIKVAERINAQVQRINTPPTPDNPMAGEEIRSVEQVVNHPETDYVPLEAFYTNINATGCQAKEGSEGMIIRSYQKDFQVMETYKISKKDLLKANPAGSDEVKAGRLTKQGLAYQPAKNDVEILEYWGFVPNDVLEAAQLPTNPDKLGEEMCIIVANKSVMVKFEANPFPSKRRPFLKFNFEEVNNEFYGVGIAEISDGPQRALNAMFRSRLDNMALSLNNIFGINYDNFMPGQDLTFKPGKAFLFHGDPRENIFPIVIPDVTANIYRDTEAMNQVIQSAHGIRSMLGGGQVKGGEQTATEVSMLMSQSTSKIKTIVARFERTIIKPLLQWYTRLTLQYMNEEEVFALFDPATNQLSFKTISPDDVAQDYEFIPRGSVKMQAANETSKYGQALQMSANPIDAQFVNRRYLWQKFYESLGLNDTEAAMMTTPAVMQQMMAQQPGQPGQPQQPMLPGTENPTSMQAPVNPQPATNTPEQPGGMLDMPNTIGGPPIG